MGKPRRVRQTAAMGLMDLEKQEPEDWHKTLPELMREKMGSVLLCLELESLSWASHLQEAGGYRGPKGGVGTPLLEVSNNSRGSSNG